MKTIGLRFQAPLLSRSNLIFNHLLLLTLLIQGCCPSRLLLEPSHFFTIVEQMPQYKGGTTQLMMDFNREFSFQGSDNEGMPSTLAFQFVITRCGKINRVKIMGKNEDSYTSFEKKGVSVLKKLQNWSPGIHHGKKVNVIMSMPIHIEIGRPKSPS